MKKPLYFLISLFAIAVSVGLIGAAVLLRQSFVPSGISQAQADLSKQIEQVGRRCLSATAPIQSREANFGLTIPVLKKYRFLVVSGRGIAAKPCLVAVSTDGEVLLMPTEFEKIVQREAIIIASPQDARDLAAAYVALTAPVGKLLVLSSLGMIPGSDRNPPRQQLKVAISAPTVENVGSDYVVRLFTWKELGGTIEQWSITVHKNGAMQVQSERLASYVGEAIGLQ